MKDTTTDLTFKCNTEGLPVTSTTWNKDNVNILDHSDNLNISQVNVLIDPYSSSYSSELTIHGTRFGELRDCRLKCDVYSDWVVSDQSNFGRQCKHKSTLIEIQDISMCMYKCNGPKNATSGHITHIIFLHMHRCRRVWRVCGQGSW